MNAHVAVEADNRFRSSDHNPELIGLTLLGGDAPAPTPSTEPSAAPTTEPSAAPSRAAPASSRKAPTRAGTASGLARTGADAGPAIGLARTGADAGPAIGIGILLAAIGGGLILASRRLRHRG